MIIMLKIERLSNTVEVNAPKKYFEENVENLKKIPSFLHGIGETKS